ncbi:MAG TPA: hypothetical protein ENN22_07940, partial [bacterium]|nr:hypothetical protein [bacterium]
VKGFLNALGDWKTNLRGERAVVLGAGGSARAVIYALIQCGIGSITIFNRTLKSAETLVCQLQSCTAFDNFSACRFDEKVLQETIFDSTIIINATSLGLFPNIEQNPLSDQFRFPESMLVFDLIYNPLETSLLRNAKAQGVRIKNGLEMLIYQGVESLKIWTGSDIDVHNYLEELKLILKQGIERDGTTSLSHSG